MMKKYEIGFDVNGLILFLLIMLPNLVWFAIPAPNDILRVDSITPVIDIPASICQFVIVIALCILKNKNVSIINIRSPLILITIGCCICYFATWVLYYQGIINSSVIMSLCIFPSIALIAFILDRKNYIAMIPTLIFTICHIIFGIVNFII